MAEKTQLIWEVGTAYDLFTSLDVLHSPDRYGLRGSWAAGVRSRLPVEKRDMLQKLLKKGHVWPAAWLSTLSGPKDSLTILETISEIPPEKRLMTLTECQFWDDLHSFLAELGQKQSWDEADKEQLRDLYAAMYKKEGKKKKRMSDDDAETMLTIWSQPEKHGEGLLDALKTYYEVFFAEEERRILPALEETVVEAKAFADELPLEELLNKLSQGLRFDYESSNKMEELLMVPSFWTTPLTLFTPVGDNSKRWIFMFGGRPANMSLVPGEVVPDLLYQTLKALADPTRLRILRYLSEEPLTPAELARRLRLRPPTVIHHLDSLRIARLVHVTLSYQGRRYEARREAIDAACELLGEFLDVA
ncbi:MAG: winged helix-turn-helix transcriptional regulator [Chloroflexi bacterium]|nr:winged helix-turn-helix transcriptional regulator [Chloroflexota bacterium]